MAHPLDSARLKTRRTWELLEQLNVEMRAFFDTQPYGVTVVPEKGDDRWWIVRAKIRRPIPEHTSLVVGDVVHNLRSALDHVVYQSATILGDGPGPRTQWPIFIDPKKWDGARDAYLKGVREPHRTRITDYQPFKNPDVLGWLATLHELDIADKHRVLGRASAAPTNADLTVPTGIVDVKPAPGMVLMEEGAEILRFQLAKGVVPSEMHVKAGFTFGANFGSEDTYASPGWLLERSYDVLEIIDAFAPEFS